MSGDKCYNTANTLLQCSKPTNGWRRFVKKSVYCKDFMSYTLSRQPQPHWPAAERWPWFCCVDVSCGCFTIKAVLCFNSGMLLIWTSRRKCSVCINTTIVRSAFFFNWLIQQWVKLNCTYTSNALNCQHCDKYNTLVTLFASWFSSLH